MKRTIRLYLVAPAALAASPVALVAAMPAALVVALQAAGAGPPGAPPEPTVEEWREDVAHYARRMEEVHEDLFHTVSRDAFAAALRSLEAGLPGMARHRVIVELARITALIGDGHTRLWLLPAEWNGFRQYPLQLYWLRDGLYVIGAPPAEPRAAGARVLRLGGVSAEEAMARVRPLVHRDNEMGVVSLAPRYLSVAEVAHALGIADSPARVSLLVETASGDRLALELEPGPPGEHALVSDLPLWAPAPEEPVRLHPVRPVGPQAPLWQSNPSEAHWYRLLDDGSTIYAQLNAIADEQGETMEAFFDRVFAEVDAGRVERLILDLHLNGGGNNFLNFPVVLGIVRRPDLDRPGKLFVIIGRRTFSAASHLVTHLERFTRAVFVGEPTGGSPNHYGDARRITLPNSGVEVWASSIYWQNSQPKEFETRTWTPPDVAAEFTIEDLREGRDPALEAIRTYREEPPLAEQLLAALREGGFRSAEEIQRAWFADPRHRYVDTESELNRLGYRLLGEGRADDAVGIFRLNADAHPGSANVWDSLGDGYRAQGRTDLAIESYRKALEVDPGFAASRQNLEQLTGEGAAGP